MTDKVKNEEIKEEQDIATEETGQPDTDTVSEETVVEKTLEEQLADAQSEIEALKDSKMRIAAESENFKKRMHREHSATLKYAGEYILKEMLPVVDNLERAVAQGVVEGNDAEQQLKALLEGVELTLKSLVASLGKFEVKAIDSLGETFDPVNHEALSMAPSETVPNNHVMTEFEKGYYYKDRLLRAAKVVVSSGN